MTHTTPSVRPARTALAVAVLAGVTLVSATSGAVAAGLVTSADIKNGTIKGQDVAGPARYSFQSIRGYVVVEDEREVAGGEASQVSASCPDGKRALSAGGAFTSGYEGVQSFVETDGTGGRVYGHNLDSGPDTLFIRVVCATAP